MDKPNYGKLRHQLTKELLKKDRVPDNRFVWSQFKIPKRVGDFKVWHNLPQENEVNAVELTVNKKVTSYYFKKVNNFKITSKPKKQDDAYQQKVETENDPQIALSVTQDNEEEIHQALQVLEEDPYDDNRFSRSSINSSSCNDSMKSSINSAGGLSILSMENQEFIE